MSAGTSLLAAVSDVGLGYGSPQVLRLSQSLMDFYQIPAVIFEPDDGRPPLALADDANYRIQRVNLTGSPYTASGRVEYLLQVAAELNRLRPSVVVIFCTYCLPVIFKLRYRPQLVVYASIESIVAYGEFDVEMNRYIQGLVDLIIFPEENRARLDMTRCGLNKIPLAIAYNAVNDGFTEAFVPPDRRILRLLYSGTIDSERTLANYFLDSGIQTRPIDLYGRVQGSDRERVEASLLLASQAKGLRYKGFISAEALSRLRRAYAYSIIIWAPTNENQRYAAPNKFFEAISDGVPPIAAPHPQCQTLIDRYQCGILMKDWSFNAFRAVIDEALTLIGTDAYQQMVDNCRTAVANELNWPAQFAKIIRLLPARL